LHVSGRIAAGFLQRIADARAIQHPLAEPQHRLLGHAAQEQEARGLRRALLRNRKHEFVLAEALRQREKLVQFAP
jgi:hypothetical protein